MTHILVVEDERSIADTIAYALRSEHFEVTWKELGQSGLAYAHDNNIDLIILDVGLPDISGFEVCKSIRLTSNVPIIFLTARKEEIDRVVGLEIGADDYVVKPFSPRELVARVKTILKRSSHISTAGSSVPTFKIDEVKARITYGNDVLDLTRYEYGMLRMLLSQTGRIFSREQFMQQVWQAPEASMDRTVDAHIKTLRAKLKSVGADSEHIKTHRGMGYSFEI